MATILIVRIHSGPEIRCWALRARGCNFQPFSSTAWQVLGVLAFSDFSYKEKLRKQGLGSSHDAGNYGISATCELCLRNLGATEGPSKCDLLKRPLTLDRSMFRSGSPKTRRACEHHQAARPAARTL